jgi:hypothetical protein
VHDHDHVSERAKNDAVAADFLAHFGADAALRVESLLRFLVGDELDADHEALPADVADVREVAQRREHRRELF